MNTMLGTLKPEERFTNRVDNYAKFRPGYPAEVVSLLADKFSLDMDAAIADVGCGTGIFTELMLKQGSTVYGIEPNDAMRAEAKKRLAGFANFKPIKGSAEQTTLPDGSINLVTAAQAFHWFDIGAAKKEFARILKPGAGTALIWNVRVNTNPRMKAYEELKKNFGVDYLLTKRADEKAVSRFFDDKKICVYSFPNSQLLDFAQLKGQLLSASYMPMQGHERYEGMVTALEEIFTKYSVGGCFEVSQETKVYLDR